MKSDNSGPARADRFFSRWGLLILGILIAAVLIVLGVIIYQVAVFRPTADDSAGVVPTAAIPQAAGTAAAAPSAAAPSPAAFLPGVQAVGKAAAPAPTMPAQVFQALNPAQVPALAVIYRSGQTFITWPERPDLQGEGYRVYRTAQAPGAAFPGGWQLLGEVGKNSASFYADRFVDENKWDYRHVPRLVIESGGAPLPAGTGLFVWTLASADFGAPASGQTAAGPGYYAVTVTPPGGVEALLAMSAQPVQEAVDNPLPVEMSRAAKDQGGPGTHAYIQYMDFRDWNPTFHAPNPSNQYLGLDPNDPNLARATAYAYDYTVFEPDPDQCGGKIPDVLPVYIYLHGWKSNRYHSALNSEYPMCGYGIAPIDESETWYFGFAKYHDFRKGGAVQKEENGHAEVIENYTEQRVLRMVDALLRQPPTPGGPKADPQRVYVFGHSMGGTGALAFAQRYPNVFAAAYSGEPMTDFRTSGVTHQDWAADVAIKWGVPDLNLPILSKGPNGWAAPLEKYNGTGVWDWENLQKWQAGDSALLGVDLGVPDHVIKFNTQGAPFFPAADASRQAWGGAASDLDHEWSKFAYAPTPMKLLTAPFWDLQVIKNESLPGLSRSSANAAFPAKQGDTYNQSLKWSSSWDPWDGGPVDTADTWQISLCAVTPPDTACGSGQPLTVDITPRRLQAFRVTPGAEYTWQNIEIRGGRVVAQGTVTARADGTLTVEQVQVSPEGNRLVIKKK